MRCAARCFVPLSLCVAVAAGCGRTVGPSEIPTVALDTFTGTIGPLGTVSHTFNVRYEVSYTDASLTITSLTSAASGTPANVTIGAAFGNISQGVCTRAPSYTSPVTSLNQELPTGDAPFRNGSYCVQLFDNPDAPTIKEPLNYSLTVAHY
jgi:hypothetical protein